MQRFDELKVGYNYENEVCRGVRGIIPSGAV